MDELSQYLGPPKRRRKEPPFGQLSFFHPHQDNVFRVERYQLYVLQTQGARWYVRVDLAGREGCVYQTSHFQSRTTAVHAALNAIARGKTADQREPLEDSSTERNGEEVVPILGT